MGIGRGIKIAYFKKEVKKVKVKVAMLLSYLEKRGMTKERFADETGISAAEIEKMLAGEAVDEPTARKFIYYLGADEAQHFVDWEAIGKINPLASGADNKGGGDE